MAEGLKGALGSDTAHLCVDMQGLFAAGSPWEVPWMDEILPVVARLAGHNPARTVFTRFLTPETADEARGSWRALYAARPEVTRARLGAERLELVPELARFVPPARVLDKSCYSPWVSGTLHRFLARARVSALVVSGGETDICVLAAVMGAIDRGYRVVLAADAVCSTFDETHDAMLRLYQMRFSHQLETAPAEEILDAWAEG